jgi:hypothetical protein
MKRLVMVRAAKPAVISRGLRHVSLCFNDPGDLQNRF